jgi:hypothetical protein
MNWLHFALVVVVSGVVASFTDWLFMGVLFHEKYREAPEVWRTDLSEGRKILYSELIGLISSAAFAWLLIAFHLQDLGLGLAVAVAVWFAGAVPVIFTNVLWMRLSPALGLSHSAGWLARLIVTALAAAYLP